VCIFILVIKICLFKLRDRKEYARKEYARKKYARKTRAVLELSKISRTIGHPRCCIPGNVISFYPILIFESKGFE
jgi:hypothetical protein